MCPSAGGEKEIDIFIVRDEGDRSSAPTSGEISNAVDDGVLISLSRYAEAAVVVQCMAREVSLYQRDSRVLLGCSCVMSIFYVDFCGT